MSHEPNDPVPSEAAAQPPALRREVVYAVADPRKFGAVSAVAALTGVAVGFALAMLAQPVHLCGATSHVRSEAAPQIAVIAPARTAELPWLGVQVTSSPARGAVVQSTFARTPAAAAGIRAGDIITGVDHAPVSSGPGLVHAIRSHAVGEAVEIVFVRDGEQRVARVALAGITRAQLGDLRHRR